LENPQPLGQYTVLQFISPDHWVGWNLWMTTMVSIYPKDDSGWHFISLFFFFFFNFNEIQ